MNADPTGKAPHGGLPLRKRHTTAPAKQVGLSDYALNYIPGPFRLSRKIYGA